MQRSLSARSGQWKYKKKGRVTIQTVWLQFMLDLFWAGKWGPKCLKTSSVFKSYTMPKLEPGSALSPIFARVLKNYQINRSPEGHSVISSQHWMIFTMEIIIINWSSRKLGAQLNVQCDYNNWIVFTLESPGTLSPFLLFFPHALSPAIVLPLLVFHSPSPPPLSPPNYEMLAGLMYCQYSLYCIMLCAACEARDRKRRWGAKEIKRGKESERETHLFYSSQC